MKTLFRKKKLKWGFYFLCFFVLCLCDQQIGSASGEMQLVCPNIVFCVLNLIVLSHYPLSAYGKCRFWLLALPCAAVAGIVFCLKWPGYYYPWQLTSGAIAAILYCCVMIQTGFAIYSAKGIPRGRRPGIGMLLLLFTCMLLSRHDQYNGPLLCLAVILVYLTDFTDQEFKEMIKALGSAILAAFFVVQGLAFVFRPYDTLRYLGMYANTNMNALFYQIVYCAFLACFCRMESKREHPFLRWTSFCFACAMWGFVLLTMCRSAMLGMAVATLLGIALIVWKQKGRWLRKGFLYVGGFVLCSLLAFPVVYGAVRYLPPVFHHPIWFMEEYSEDKVHSWDPYDSEKYTDWRDVIQGNFGRLLMMKISPQAKLNIGAPLSLKGQNPVIFAAPQPPVILCSGGSAADVPGAVPAAAEENPLEGNSVLGRFKIYRHYMSQLNLLGHKESENGIQLTENFFAPHAHNIILQYAFNYGVPAGLIMLVYLIASGIRLLMLCLRDDTEMTNLLPLLLFASVAAFGMLEVVWRFGQLSYTLVLLLPCFAWRGAADSHRQSLSADCG